jgi:hypothetical protein
MRGIAPAAKTCAAWQNGCSTSDFLVSPSDTRRLAVQPRLRLTAQSCSMASLVLRIEQLALLRGSRAALVCASYKERSSIPRGNCLFFASSS